MAWGERPGGSWRERLEMCKASAGQAGRNGVGWRGIVGLV